MVESKVSLPQLAVEKTPIFSLQTTRKVSRLTANPRPDGHIALPANIQAPIEKPRNTAKKQPQKQLTLY
jgi:hypothetical protein